MGARRLALPVVSRGAPPAQRKTSTMSQPTTDSTTSAAKSAQAPMPPRPNAVIRFFKRLFVSIFLLALAALIFFLLSERNARLFKLELSESGELTVLRGRHLPMGFTPWTPQDLQLAETYAPFVLDESARSGLDLNRVYDERDALDRALFDAHREAIEQRAGQSDAATLEEVVRLLRRAERLPGLSDDQKRQLRDLQIRTAYFEGRQRLREAGALLQQAISKLRLATEGEKGRYTSAAEGLLNAIQDSARHIASAVDEEAPQALSARPKEAADAPAGTSPKPPVPLPQKLEPEAPRPPDATVDAVPTNADAPALPPASENAAPAE